MSKAQSDIDATFVSAPRAEGGPAGRVSSRVLRATIDAPRLDRDLARDHRVLPGSLGAQDTSGGEPRGPGRATGAGREAERSPATTPIRCSVA